MLKKEQVELAINEFLAQQIDKTTLKDRKKIITIERSIEELLSDSKPTGNQEKKKEKLLNELSKTKERIDRFNERHIKDVWIKNAAEGLSRTATLGTHISKGIHSSSKGGNVIFNQATNKCLPVSIVGTHSLIGSSMDMTGNAAALPLYNFLEVMVGDKKIKELIVADDPEMISALSCDAHLAASYHALFKNMLTEGDTKPKAGQLNKQVLFPITKHPRLNDSEDYINIVPLFPSALTFSVHQKLGAIRNRKTINDDAYNNRYDKSVPPTEQKPYVRLRNLARLSLGGSQPQNVSKLISAQSGSVKLLPCLPPKTFAAKKYYLSKSSDSFFNKQLYKSMSGSFDELKKALGQYHYKPNAVSKKRVSNAVKLVSIMIFEAAMREKNNPAGWLSEHNIPLAQKFWLDADYYKQEGNEYLAKKRASADWQDAILNDAARFIDNQLRSMIGGRTHQFNDDTVADLKVLLCEVANDYKLKGRGVFL